LANFLWSGVVRLDDEDARVLLKVGDGRPVKRITHQHQGDRTPGPNLVQGATQPGQKPNQASGGCLARGHHDKVMRDDSAAGCSVEAEAGARNDQRLGKTLEAGVFEDAKHSLDGR
jgi:hypothetical protein